MKFKVLIVLLLTVTFSGFAASHFWRGTTLGLNEIEKRWGKTELKTDAFRDGDLKLRASMAYSLIKHQDRYKGMFVLDVRKTFGDPDGFYFSDLYPAYLVQRAQTKNEEAWQIVFLLNKDRKVTEIIMHKNCCGD